MKYFISLILVVFVLGLTFLDKTVSGMEELFVGGTNYVFFKIISAGIVIKSILSAIFIISFFVWLKFKKKKYLLTLMFAFILWFQSGRTIAINSQDGQIITGWFFLNTNEFKICQENQDCEFAFYNQINFEKMFLWRIKINNSTKENIIFIGPFIWNDYLEFLDDFSSLRKFDVNKNKYNPT